MADTQEDIVMTPTKKGEATHIKIERKKRLTFEDKNVAHIGGGEHKGLVINNQSTDENDDLGKPQLQLGFACFLVDQKTGAHLVETRKLKFWYVDGTEYLEQVTRAYDFFKELIRPEDFPRDYVGFIKKCMKQMQGPNYTQIKRVELSMQQLDQSEAPLSPGLPKIDNRPKDEILREKMLHILESAYPNILAVEDICRITAADEVMVREQLKELHVRNLVTEMEQGGFMRHVLDEKSEVQLVKQMPTIAVNQQPTIAIITAMYYEKLAVDAMMENKTTYMKYKTEGESNVYTIGFIGEHKVVSTKLPAIGHARSAQISSGNTTTRLLGTFQNIAHVFVVGVAGGVPYYTDYYKHVRLGDVVISRGEDRDVIYYYCEKILKNKSGDLQYIHKTFAPKDNCLQQTARKIVETSETNPGSKPWELYVEEGQKLLQGQEVHFMRPSSNTDRLYMNIGEDNVIEVEHPQPPEEIASTFDPDKPRVHFGVLGSGRPVVKSDAIRLDFAGKYNIKAFDTEFDQVLESIEGNRKDSFMFIRGVSDYNDGSKNKEWQPYAALTAAAFMKTIIKALSNPLVEDL
ncbi:uncharacterized protein LOC115212809 isoform X4 [Argonauta hians]